jgi:hypothetical protein
MNLLQRPEGSGYPTEYLIARLRGRRAYLVKDWNNLLTSTGPLDSQLPARYRELIVKYSQEGVWKHMLREFQWIYLQMNRGLRNTFYPFFIYSEIKTITLCLRYKAEKETGALVEDLLSFSLLSEKFKKVLKAGGEDLSSILAELERKFLYSPDKLAGLNEIFLKDGLKGVEERLTNDFIEKIMRSKLESVLKMFFTYLIDIKNIITLYKHMRWSVKTDPAFIRGGSIGESNLRKIVQNGELSGIVRLMYQLTGVKVHDLDAAVIENTLYTSLTRHLRNVSRERADIGLILDYLWKIYIEALNLSVLFYGRGVERKDIRKELVMI